jgi:anti-sigma-K factor RskA
MANNDDDLDALAAEYVLGTLAADERAHAEALLASDPGFAETVRQWERRLGELNVMVEAVEPPPELWDNIKANIESMPSGDHVTLAPAEPGAAPAVDAAATATPAADDRPDAKALAALASTLTAPESGAAGADPEKDEAKAKPAADWTLKPPQTSSGAPAAAAAKPERSGADVVYLAHRVRRWRLAAVGAGAIAAVLAALIVASQVAPGAFANSGFIHLPQFAAHPPAAALAPANGSRLVAVLQQDPTAPAFLLTVDPNNLNLTVRRVSAAADAAHSYELWLISPRFPKPRSLGVVGANEFTQRALAKDYDLDTLRNATYKISFEPAGGSKTGAPSGPVLFGGRLVEAVPPPAAPAQPKT